LRREAADRARAHFQRLFEEGGGHRLEAYRAALETAPHEGPDWERGRLEITDLLRQFARERDALRAERLRWNADKKEAWAKFKAERDEFRFRQRLVAVWLLVVFLGEMLLLAYIIRP